MSCIAAAGLIPLRAAPVRRAASAKSSKVRTRNHSFITHCDPLVFLRSPKWEQRKPERGGPDARSDASSRVGSRVHATRRAASGGEARVPRCDAVRVSSRDASPARSRRSNRHRGPRFTTLRTNQSVTGPTRGDARAVRPGRCDASVLPVRCVPGGVLADRTGVRIRVQNPRVPRAPAPISPRRA